MSQAYHHDRHKTPRQTARAIVIDNNHILLIERRRDKLHYFSFPGGGIDDGETAEQAVQRELKEETSVSIEALNQLYEYNDKSGNKHLIFLCRYETGEPNLQSDSEEAESMKRTHSQDSYEPKWIDLVELSYLPFGYWEPVASQLIQDLKSGWSSHVVKLQAKL